MLKNQFKIYLSLKEINMSILFETLKFVCHPNKYKIYLLISDK